MSQGFVGFKELLKNYRYLIFWAVLAAAPITLAFAEVSPPWPSNVAALTAVLQLVVFVLCFQFFSSSPRRTVNRVLILSFLALLVSSAGYIYLLRNFTYEARADAKGTIERRVKGFVCTPIAQQSNPDTCPYLGKPELNLIENRPDGLWTQRSIDAVHMALVATWMLAFISLTSLLGVFLAYQKRFGARKPRAAG